MSVPLYIFTSLGMAIDDATSPGGQHTNGPCYVRIPVSHARRIHTHLLERATSPDPKPTAVELARDAWVLASEAFMRVDDKVRQAFNVGAHDTLDQPWKDAMEAMIAAWVTYQALLAAEAQGEGVGE